MLATQADRIETGVRSVLRRVESDQEGFVKLIQTAITAQVREATIALETQQGRVIDGAEKAMCDAELGVTRLLESITQKTQIQLEIREVGDRTAGSHRHAQSPDPARCSGT